MERAYLLTGIAPKADKLAQLTEVLHPLTDHPWSWVITYWSHVNSQLKVRKNAGLDLDDLAGYGELQEKHP